MVKKSPNMPPKFTQNCKKWHQEVPRPLRTATPRRQRCHMRRHHQNSLPHLGTFWAPFSLIFGPGAVFLESVFGTLFWKGPRTGKIAKMVPRWTPKWLQKWSRIGSQMVLKSMPKKDQRLSSEKYQFLKNDDFSSIPTVSF